MRGQLLGKITPLTSDCQSTEVAAAVCQFLPKAISGSHLCAVFCQWHKYSGKLGQKAAQN